MMRMIITITIMKMIVVTSGEILCKDNRQFIGKPLIVLTRQDIYRNTRRT